MHRHFRPAIALLAMALPLVAQQHNRTENVALLGVVTIEAEGGVTVAHVLPDSPAAAAGLRAGDVLLKIRAKKIRRATDVDAALQKLDPTQKVAVRTRRKGQKDLTLRTTLVARKDYTGDFLKPRETGSVGFAAPQWWGFGWSNVTAEQSAPTRENTRGKVVVLHAFQAW